MDEQTSPRDYQQLEKQLTQVRAQLAAAQAELRQRLPSESGMRLERDQPEEPLLKWARKYFALFDTTSDGVWIHSLDGRIREVNDAYCRMSGYSREEILGMPISQLEANESPTDIAEHIQKVLNTGGHDRFESRHRRKDGTVFDVDITALQLDFEVGEIAILVRDITERRRAQEAIRESRQKYQALIETTSDFIWEMDALGRYTYCSPQMEELWGLKPDEMIGKTPFDVMPPEHREVSIAFFQEIVKSPHPFSGLETAAVLERGRLVRLETSGVPFFDRDGRLLGFRGISRDITERKQIDDALRVSEQKFATAFHSNAAAMTLTRVADGCVIDANEAWLRLAGLRKEEALGKTAQEHGCWKSLSNREDMIRALNRTGCVRDQEVSLRGQSGEERTAILSAQRVTLQGEQLLLTSAIDITDRKRAEQALRESEERTAFALEIGQTGSWDLDLVDHTAHRSLTHDRIFGYETLLPEWTYETFLQHVVPEDRAMVDEKFRRATKAKADWNFECRICRNDGRTRWIWAAGRHCPDASGRMRRMSGIVQDITERKLADERLQDLSQRLNYHVDHSPLAVIEWGPDMRLVRWSGAAERLFGWKAEEVLGKRMEDFHWIYDEDRAHVADVGNDLQTGRNSQRFSTNRNYRKDGSVVECEWYNSSLVDGAGRLRSILSLVLDVTERKRAEEELRRAKDDLEIRVKERTAELEQTAAILEKEAAERQLAQEATASERHRFFGVLDTLPVMICLITTDHHVPFANRAFREAFGSADGRRCYEYQLGRKDPCPECQAFVPLETGRPHHWEWTIPDGRTIDIHSFPFRDADGSTLILEIDVDITERRRAETELHQAHEDLTARAAQLRALAGELTLTEQRERRRMAKVLHDHLQQLLVAAKFRMAILGRAGDEVVAQGAEEVKQLLDGAIDASRSLTAELSPPILHESGLNAGLEWLARWMADKHGLVVDLSMEEVPRLPEDVTILLYEATRELLFNAVKHAHVRLVTVTLRQIEGTELQITVSDKGPGFDPRLVKKAGEAGGGFGLFSIRERLDLIGGKMEVESAPGKGSRFTLTCRFNSERLETMEATSAPAPAVPGRVVQLGPPVAGARIRLLLADDHKITREGLIHLLGAEPDIEIAGEAADGEMAIRLAQELRPDIVLMDLNMPKFSGIDATRAIRQKLPEVQVIALSMFDEAERAQSMYDAGAFAYLAKTGPTQALINAIRACWASVSGGSARSVEQGNE